MTPEARIAVEGLAHALDLGNESVVVQTWREEGSTIKRQPLGSLLRSLLAEIDRLEAEIAKLKEER